MKNIETILAEIDGITDEQKSVIISGVTENYKTIAEYQKMGKKIEKAEAERDDLQSQLNDANATLDGLKDVDVDGLNKQIEEYKARAEQAEADAQNRVTTLEQRDWLAKRFDELGVKSERTRKSLSSEIMGADGLKWKDGQFLGFTDYVNAENEKDHFFETAEEKALREKQEGAEKKAPKFTEKGTEGDAKEPERKFTVPKIW